MSGGRAEIAVIRARPWRDGAPLPGADAIAVADGRILAVGTADEIAALSGPSTVTLDAAGATVTAGLTDAHIHLLAWARSLDEVDLMGASSREECLARVRRFAEGHPDATVLIGRGFDANDWSEPPHRAALDAATGARPALLHSKDYHALWVNSAALAAAGVTRATADPAGGRFGRDADGAPDGRAFEHATRAFAAIAPPRDEASDRDALARAARALHAQGVTAVHDFEDRAAAAIHRAQAARGSPSVRMLAALAHRELDEAIAAGLRSGDGDDLQRVGAVKLFADGTLGSRTAALLEPYDDGSGDGMELMPPEALAETVARALAAGIAVAVHAIGDRACRRVLDAFETAGPLRGRPSMASRIEHVQLAHPDDLDRFRALGIVASVQPQHWVTDLDLARRVWSGRLDRAYPWRSLLARGAMVVAGSDAPVEPPIAAAGIAAAVTRRRPGDRDGATFGLDERLSLDQALAAYVEAPARLAGTWPRIGRLAGGAIADVVVWDRDLHAADAAGLHEARPRWTLWNGRVSWDAAHGGATSA